jgi:hypothetical protein
MLSQNVCGALYSRTHIGKLVQARAISASSPRPKPKHYYSICMTTCTLFACILATPLVLHTHHLSRIPPPPVLADDPNIGDL